MKSDQGKSEEEEEEEEDDDEEEEEEEEEEDEEEEEEEENKNNNRRCDYRKEEGTRKARIVSDWRGYENNDCTSNQRKYSVGKKYGIA